jgi:hypothetical protein
MKHALSEHIQTTASDSIGGHAETAAARYLAATLPSTDLRGFINGCYHRNDSPFGITGTVVLGPHNKFGRRFD